MNPASDIVNAPILYKVGDKTYEVSALSNEDLGVMTRLVQFYEYNTLLQLPNVSQELKDKTFLECLRKVVSPSGEQYAAITTSPQGDAEYAYLSLRHKHPTITREEVNAFPPLDVVNISRYAQLLCHPPTEETKKKIAAVRAQLAEIGRLA